MKKFIIAGAAIAAVAFPAAAGAAYVIDPTNGQVQAGYISVGEDGHVAAACNSDGAGPLQGNAYINSDGGNSGAPGAPGDPGTDCDSDQGGANSPEDE